jgi:hypothetical protein
MEMQQLQAVFHMDGFELVQSAQRFRDGQAELGAVAAG